MRNVINIVASVAILAVGVLCLQLFGEKPEIPKQAADDLSLVPLVETAEVQLYEDPLWLEANGEASTYRVLTVGAEVEGQILNKPEAIRGGAYVHKGDLLFRIDDLNFRLEIERLQAERDRTQAELGGLDVDLDNLKPLLELAARDLELRRKQTARIKQLYERNATTEAELESAQRQDLTAQNAVQTLLNQKNQLVQQQVTKQAQIRLIDAQIKRVEADVKRCEVVSPVDGRLVADVVEQGDFVRVGDTLVQISDGSRMEVRCNLQAEELGWVWRQELARSGDISTMANQSDDPIHIRPVPCEVTFTFDGVETIWDAEIVRFDGMGIDRETRTFPCRVIVSNPRATRVRNSNNGPLSIAPPVLLSGMYVTVRIPISSPHPLLQVPQESLHPGDLVWVAREGQLLTVRVSVIQKRGDIAILSSDGNAIQAGDVVVTSPLSSVFDGMPVRENEVTR